MEPEQPSLLPDPAPPAEPLAEPLAEPPAPATPSVEELQARLAEEARQRELLQSSLDQSNRMLEQLAMRREPPPSPPAPPPDPEPDPETQPEAHLAWQRRQNALAIRGVVREELAPVHQRLEHAEYAQRMDRLWQEFQSEYPQFAAAQDAAQVAFNLEFPDGRAGTNPTEFKRRIAQRMERMMTQLAPRPSPQDPPARSPNTSGLSGGSGARSSPPPSEPKPVKIKTFTDLIRERQQNSPFY